MHSREDSVAAVEAALRDLRDGRMVIVVDDESRENEGDLIMAAQHAKPEQVAFMIRHTSGILCTPLERDHARRLSIAPVVGDRHGDRRPLDWPGSSVFGCLWHLRSLDPRTICAPPAKRFGSGPKAFCGRADLT